MSTPFECRYDGHYDDDEDLERARFLSYREPTTSASDTGGRTGGKTVRPPSAGKKCPRSEFVRRHAPEPEPSSADDSQEADDGQEPAAVAETAAATYQKRLARDRFVRNRETAALDIVDRAMVDMQEMVIGPMLNKNVPPAEIYNVMDRCIGQMIGRVAEAMKSDNTPRWHPLFEQILRDLAELENAIIRDGIGRQSEIAINISQKLASRASSITKGQK